jgi:serine/threonine protein kinase
VDSVFRERNLLQELQHPNIIKQYFTFQDEANLYYVFEYASRGSLTKLINKLSMGENRMPYELAKYYAAEIVLAIEAMHKHRIIHRDLKPENILITEDWHLKLIDFGDAIKFEDEKGQAQVDEEEKM